MKRRRRRQRAPGPRTLVPRSEVAINRRSDKHRRRLEIDRALEHVKIPDQGLSLVRAPSNKHHCPTCFHGRIHQTATGDERHCFMPESCSRSDCSACGTCGGSRYVEADPDLVDAAERAARAWGAAELDQRIRAGEIGRDDFDRLITEDMVAQLPFCRHDDERVRLLLVDVAVHGARQGAVNLWRDLWPPPYKIHRIIRQRLVGERIIDGERFPVLMLVDAYRRGAIVSYTLVEDYCNGCGWPVASSPHLAVTLSAYNIGTKDECSR